MGFDRVATNLSTEYRKVFLNHHSLDDVSCMAHQQGEQSPLAPSQIEQSPIGPYLSGRPVEYDAAGLHRRVMHHLGTSQKGTDAGQQFLMAEGLDHVVVGPAVEAGNTVVDSRARRDHEDRRVAAGRSQVPNQRNAVTVGKAEIDDGQVIVDGCRGGPGVGNRVDDIHDVVGIAQALAQQFLQSGAVLYQKQLHDNVAPRVTTGSRQSARAGAHCRAPQRTCESPGYRKFMTPYSK